MKEITVKIEGMKCVNCEAHVNNAISKNFDIKKVNSSHSTGETIILVKTDIDESKLKAIIEEAGFEVISVKICEKKGIFSFFQSNC